MDSLITLDSPVVRNKLKASYNTRSPLIPCPNIPITNETQNNPFDAVVCAVELNQLPNDPFDIVLKASIKDSSTNSQEFPKNSLNNSDISNDDENITEKNRETETESCNSSMKDESDLVKIKANVKEFVSKRIISCIKRAINTTPQNNSTKPGQSNYRRSFSAGVIRPAGFGPEEETIYSSCSSLNTSLPLERNYCSKTKNSAPYDCNDFELTKMKLRGEAKKFTRLIRHQPQNTSSSDDANDDSNQDLIDTAAPWLCHNEEDSIGLPKLKTYRHSFSGISNNKSVLEERVVNEYMKRRHSNDYSQSNKQNKEEDTSQIVECFTPDKETASSSIIEVSDNVISDDDKKNTDIKQDKQIDAHFVSDIVGNQSLRPKKKAGSEFIKKGPMKAVVPLQKMTKHISEKLSSPFNKMQLNSKNFKNENMEIDIQPVAASTPTSQSPVSSATKARLRGRENNKMSPTGRKATRRSSSVGVVGSRRMEQLGTPTKAVNTPREAKINKAVVSNSKVPARPQSAPDGISSGQNYVNFKRAALKALAVPPLIKPGNKTAIRKIASAQTPKVPAQDKENRVFVKK